MSPRWSCSDDEVLINFVRNHEALYNVKSRDFRKTQLKQNLWRELAKSLNRTDSDCLKRWCYVRDYYIRRKGKSGVVSSGEAASIRSDLLSFLDNQPTQMIPINTSNGQERLNLFRKMANRRPLEPDMDETDLFFRSMAKIVKNLPKHEQVQLRMQIGSLVGNAELRCISTVPTNNDVTVVMKNEESDDP